MLRAGFQVVIMREEEGHTKSDHQGKSEPPSYKLLGWVPSTLVQHLKNQVNKEDENLHCGSSKVDVLRPSANFKVDEWVDNCKEGESERPPDNFPSRVPHVGGEVALNIVVAELEAE